MPCIIITSGAANRLSVSRNSHLKPAARALNLLQNSNLIYGSILGARSFQRTKKEGVPKPILLNVYGKCYRWIATAVCGAPSSLRHRVERAVTDGEQQAETMWQKWQMLRV